MSNVLVVDDNEINAMVLETMLVSFGASVTTVLSGREAVEEAAVNEFDMIFVDYIMPEMDGVETTKKIRLLKTHEPVIVIITAEVTDQLRTLFVSAGANEALEKPLSRDSLGQCLGKYLGEDGVVLAEVDKTPGNKDDLPENERARLIFSKIRGFDYDLGIHYSLDDTGNFLRLVKTSVSNIRGYINDLTPMADNHKIEIRPARIIVHSLRSVLLNIGIKSLSNEAAALEDAANRGDERTILKSLPGFIGSLSETSDALEEAVRKYYEEGEQENASEGDEAAPGKTVSPEEYKDMIRQVMVPLERYEIIFIREALQELLEVSEGENRVKIKEALEASDNFDYETIRTCVNRLE